jgi:cbb3-type cytochrome oxidase subunit 3
MSNNEMNDKELINGLKKYWYIWLTIAFLGIFWFVYTKNETEAIEAKSKQINLKLETIEDQINIELKNGNKDKALSLSNQLVHPYHEIYSGTEENWYSDPKYYDEYWNEKRKFYKNRILNK